MTQTNTRIRLATTAMIAALAISSTPLLAQDAQVPDTATETPVTPAPDPLAPVTDTATETPAAEPEASETTAAPARPTATRRTITRTEARPAPSPRAAPATAAAAAPAPAAAVAAAPVEAAPVAQAPPPAPAEPAPVELIDNGLTLSNEMLPIAGAALVGLLALVGAFLLIRRRRRLRRIEDDEVAYEPEADLAEPRPAMFEPSREPAFAAASAAAPAATAGPAHDPVPGADQAPALSEDFDLSKFSPRVQAAYRGPTPDNPSVSLKHRLSHAALMDEREAAAGTRREAEPGESGGFLLGRGGSATEDRPAFNKVG